VQAISDDITQQTVCAHCGDPCSSNAVHHEGHVFCCAGCRSVFEIVQSNNLCTYYTLDEASGVSMKGARADAYEALDTEEIARQFVEFDNGRVRRLRFEIPSMHCASCVWLLEQLDRLNPGIERSEVDFMRKLVRIDIDKTQTTTRAVAQCLASIGYAPLIRPEGATGVSPAIRQLYMRLGVAGFAAGNVMMFSIARYFAGPGGMSATLTTLFDVLSIALSIPVLLYSASSWWTSAWAALRQLRLNLDVPVALGIVVLFARSVVDISLGRSEGFLDSFTGLVFFLLIGKLFQQKAFDAVSFDRTYRSFFPLSVRVERQGAEQSVPVDSVGVGETMLIRNGEVVPCDAVLVGRGGYVDYSFVTGESVPVECVDGSLIYAGGKVVGGRIRLTVVKSVSHGYLASLWNASGDRRHRTTLLELADSFGAWFTIGAVTTAVVGGLLWLPDIGMALTALSAVLIIACPCALTLAAPATLGTAMALLGRRKLFVKNVGVLLDLARSNAFVFDKTGTLTTAAQHLEWLGPSLSAEQKSAIVSVASQSVHPVSRSIVTSIDVPAAVADEVAEYVGQGIVGRSGGHRVAIGSADFVQESNGHDAAAAFVAIDGRVVGGFAMMPSVRPGVIALIGRLRTWATVNLVSGDSAREASVFEPVFGRESIRFNATPYDKVDALQRLADTGHRTVMIGDGLNDAGAMRAAHVGIAVSDETATLVPACDIIMDGAQVHTIDRLVRYSKQVRSLIWFSLVFSMVYNVIGVGLAVTGQLAPVVVAIMMPVSSLIVTAVSVLGARWFGRGAVWA